jgi:hypothetical protein
LALTLLLCRARLFAAMSQFQSESDEILDVVLSAAESLIAKQGEFFPFGATMDRSGEIAMAGGYLGIEDSPAAEVIALLKEGFHAGALTGEYRVTAIAYAVTFQLPAATSKSDAVAVNIDHEEGNSVIVCFPYTVSAGAVKLGEAFAQEGTYEIFGKR